LKGLKGLKGLPGVEIGLWEKIKKSESENREHFKNLIS